MWRIVAYHAPSAFQAFLGASPKPKDCLQIRGGVLCWAVMVTDWVHSGGSGVDDAVQDERSPGTTASPRSSAGDRLPVSMGPDRWYGLSRRHTRRESRGRRFRERRFTRI